MLLKSTLHFQNQKDNEYTGICVINCFQLPCYEYSEIRDMSMLEEAESCL